MQLHTNCSPTLHSTAYTVYTHHNAIWHSTLLHTPYTHTICNRTPSAIRHSTLLHTPYTHTMCNATLLFTLYTICNCTPSAIRHSTLLHTPYTHTMCCNTPLYFIHHMQLHTKCNATLHSTAYTIYTHHNAIRHSILLYIYTICNWRWNNVLADDIRWTKPKEIRSELKACSA